MRILRTASSLTSRNIAFSRLFPLPGHYTVLVVGVKETGGEAVPERKFGMLCDAARPSDSQGEFIQKESSRPGDPMARRSRSYCTLLYRKGSDNTPALALRDAEAGLCLRVHTPKVTSGFVIGLFSSSSLSLTYFSRVPSKSDGLTGKQVSS